MYHCYELVAKNMEKKRKSELISPEKPDHPDSTSSCPTCKLSSSKRDIVKREELQCKVCLELPENGKFHQCEHGHLFCSECLTRILEGNQAICPVCRVSLSRSRPTRNRFAELILAQLLVPCMIMIGKCFYF